MSSKTKNIVLTVLMAVLLLGFFGWNLAKEEIEVSESERRALAKFPELTLETVLSGEFTKEFETFTLDQFPMRDTFRSIKAICSHYIFMNMDNNDVFVTDGHISKLEYPLKDAMVSNAAEKFNNVYEMMIKDSSANVYLSVIPDKNMFLAAESGHLMLDYEELAEYMQGEMEYAEYIDIMPLLSADDYYFTDSHWRQENIIDVADKITQEMNVPFSDDFTVNTVDNPFYGTYYGQAALPLKPETIYYLTNDATENCTVYSYDTGMPEKVPVYNMENANGRDPYEMFLSGNQALLVIENPLAETDKELVIFRDSFGSSLTPLIIQSYSKITVVDIRYVYPQILKNMVKFDGADVLFIYSTVLLNNSTGLR